MMKLTSFRAALLMAVLSLSGAHARGQAQDQYSGIDPDGFDRNIRAQDDLFQHVNGRWLLTTEIPGDKSNYGSFTALDDMARENIKTIIEEAAAKPADETAQKIGDFYRSYMNEEVINQRGIQPLQTELKAVQSLENAEQLIRLLGRWQSKGVGGPIGFFVGTDAKDSTRYLAADSQSGTTLPDRDYYLKDDERYVIARNAMKAYIAKLYELAKLSDGPAAARLS